MIIVIVHCLILYRCLLRITVLVEEAIADAGNSGYRR